MMSESITDGLFVLKIKLNLGLILGSFLLLCYSDYR